MENYPFSKINYIIMGVSFLMIVIGFILMTGSKTVIEFNPDIFSFRRITLAPIVIICGFITLIAGIFWKQKQSK